MVLGSNKDKYIKEKCLWDKEFVQNIAQTFRDNMSGGKHHGSVGNYMGLGTTPRYSINNDCSFGTFSQKKSTDNLKRQTLLNVLEKYLKFVQDELNTVMHSVVSTGHHIVNSLLELCKHVFPNIVAELELLNGNLITVNVCRNAQTKQHHCAPDCSYTMIAIPCTTNNISTQVNYVFQFQCTLTKMLSISFHPGTCLYYAGHSIMHRQISNQDNGRDLILYNFWNLAAYSNRALYSNIMASMRRILTKFYL